MADTENLGTETPAVKRLRALFNGPVQGVGFRFTTCRIASYFSVTGYVKNLPDGRVEVVAEGSEKILKDFFKAVSESELTPYIRSIDTQWLAAEGRFNKFEIAY